MSLIHIYTHTLSKYIKQPDGFYVHAIIFGLSFTSPEKIHIIHSFTIQNWPDGPYVHTHTNTASTGLPVTPKGVHGIIFKRGFIVVLIIIRSIIYVHSCKQIFVTKQQVKIHFHFHIDHRRP